MEAGSFPKSSSLIGRWSHETQVSASKGVFKEMADTL